MKFFFLCFCIFYLNTNFTYACQKDWICFAEDQQEEKERLVLEKYVGKKVLQNEFTPTNLAIKIDQKAFAQFLSKKENLTKRIAREEENLRRVFYLWLSEKENLVANAKLGNDLNFLKNKIVQNKILLENHIKGLPKNLANFSIYVIVAGKTLQLKDQTSTKEKILISLKEKSIKIVQNNILPELPFVKANKELLNLLELNLFGSATIYKQYDYSLFNFDSATFETDQVELTIAEIFPFIQKNIASSIPSEIEVFSINEKNYEHFIDNLLNLDDKEKEPVRVWLQQNLDSIQARNNLVYFNLQSHLKDWFKTYEKISRNILSLNQDYNKINERYVKFSSDNFIKQKTKLERQIQTIRELKLQQLIYQKKVTKKAVPIGPINTKEWIQLATHAYRDIVSLRKDHTISFLDFDAKKENLIERKISLVKDIQAARLLYLNAQKQGKKIILNASFIFQSRFIPEVEKSERGDSFRNEETANVKICEHPTLEQKKTLKALASAVDTAYNPLSCVSLYQKLSKQEELWLQKNDLTDLTPLSSLNSLERLYLWNNKITNLSPIRFLRSLKILKLDNNSITDLDPLSNLTGLVDLSLSNNTISNLDPLKFLKSLRYLDLENNKISDLEGISSLTNLSHLVLSRNFLKSIKQLASLKKLHWLKVNNNSLSSVSPLADLSNLNHLNLAYNRVKDISPLTKLINLEYLNLLENSVGDISSLDRLIKLGSLYVSRDYLRECSPKNILEIRRGKSC